MFFVTGIGLPEGFYLNTKLLLIRPCSMFFDRSGSLRGRAFRRRGITETANFTVSMTKKNRRPERFTFDNDRTGYFVL